ncbi:MAG: hypothetical protein RR090_06355 [Niameybacter sp.]|uniref:hypothetical protein n=1 Tax=Niameybacter sp. TaxID=2033640 RepID=UPI002FC67E08
MELIKNKIRVVSYFLPRNAQLVTLENYCGEPAVLEGDLDQDGELEMMALYKKDEIYYLIGLKKEKKWYVAWNRAVKYKGVQHFQITHVQDAKRCEVAIAGKIEGMAKSQLMLLEWTEEAAQSLLADYIAYDKLYIQDVDSLDGKDEIILWKNKELEAYDVHIYRYKKGTLVEDTSLDAFYYPTIVGYYEYLQELYPEETIYTTYLEEARLKCVSGTSNKTDMDFLLGMSAYLEKDEVEEDVFLTGKKEKDADYFTHLQLVATHGHQTRNQLMNLEVEKVYDYEMKVGRFLESETEQVFIKINAKTQEAPTRCWIIGIERGYLYNYLQQEMYLEATKYRESIAREGEVKGTYEEASGHDEIKREMAQERIDKLGEGYPIEISAQAPLMLGMKHTIWCEKTNQVVGYKLRLFKGEKNQFKLYKTFVMREEEGG